MPQPQPQRPRIGLAVAALAAVLLFLPGLLRAATDWWWFGEIGFERVFATLLGTRAALFGGTALVTFVVLYVNLRLGQRGLVPDPVVVRLTPAAPHVDVTGTLRRLSLPVSLGLAALLGLGALQLWPEALLALNRAPFGVTDPVFGRDVGFYVFSLPALSALLGLLTTIVTFALAIAIPVYWLRGDVIVAPRHVRVEPSAQLHLGTLLAVLFLLTAARHWWVSTADLLYSTTGPLVGASHADLAVRLPALRIQAIIAAVAAVAVVVGALRRTVVWYAALATGAYMLVAIVGGGIAPAVVQRLIVTPNELTLEADRIGHHIEFTRRAWGLDAVETRSLPGEAQLTAADLAANAGTIENVRLWDREPLLQTFGQLQEIRTYYEFASVDDDRYWIDGRYRQVLLSPRELASSALPTRNFINTHLTFTHGMGLTLAPASEVTAEGLPVLYVQDLPPTSTRDITVTRPQLYYGELTTEFAVVNTRQQEFDYPAAEGNVFTRYEGSGGVRVGSFPRRLLLAARFGSLTFLLSPDMSAESRVLFRRQVRERAQTALPFVTFDSDPYMVVDSAGALHWMLDAYTTSRRYPYAQSLRNGVNYMRNSVKVTIDAYNGTVTAYVADPRDPVAQAWGSAFPGVLRPLAEMPADLRAHVRYPEDLYRAQTDLYRIYHMNDATTFYHREDEWQIPQIDNVGDRVAPFMRRIIMRLPEETGEEFIFMTPYTPRQKDNLAAWMVARSDGDAYGQLRVYSFPRQSLVFGPRQVVNRINQDPEISRQFALWDQRGSQVIRGELLVIPIGPALLYVQPIYLRAEGGRIPELTRVVVAYQNQVVMAESLGQALELLFGPGAGSATPAATPVTAAAAEGTAATPTAGVPAAGVPAAGTGVTPPRTAASDSMAAALRAEALQHYERAVQAQRAGDWATYGTELDRLGAVLRRLAAGRP